MATGRCIKPTSGEIWKVSKNRNPKITITIKREIINLRFWQIYRNTPIKLIPWNFHMQLVLDIL